MNEEFIKLAAFILAGALSGGLTNTVAIWMLFHPYEPPKLLRRWRLGFFQGAIPKNQPRLAAAIGKTVGDRLLTAEDLTQTFTDETFRATFDEPLGSIPQWRPQHERAALRDLIPERVMPDIEVLLEEGLDKALAQLDDYLESERFAEAMQHRAGDLVEAIKDEPIGSLITSARGAALSRLLRSGSTMRSTVRTSRQRSRTTSIERHSACSNRAGPSKRSCRLAS